MLAGLWKWSLVFAAVLILDLRMTLAGQGRILGCMASMADMLGN